MGFGVKGAPQIQKVYPKNHVLNTLRMYTKTVPARHTERTSAVLHGIDKILLCTYSCERVNT